MIAKRILVGITLGVILALLVVPQTGWMVNTQPAAVLHLRPLGLMGPLEPGVKVQEIAARNPNDYQLQYAAALDNRHQSPVQALRALERRFPNNASLRANVLRYACSYIHADRPENYLFGQSSVPSARLRLAPNPATDAAALKDVAVGERLDATNAYFPMIGALCFYDMHQDAKARVAILRTGRCTHWNEYSQDEIEGEWRLNSLVDSGGKFDAVSRATVVAGQLYLEYAGIRATTRVGTYQAMHDEIQGDFATSIALRQALIHTGDLMRTYSTSTIGTMVGMFVSEIAMERPDGAPALKYYPTTTQYRAKVVESYIAFLSHHKGSQDAKQVEDEAQAAKQVWQIIDFGSPKYSPYVISNHVFPWWMTCLLVLTNAFWMLVLGGISVAITRFGPIRGPLKLGAFLLGWIAVGYAVWWTTYAARTYSETFYNSMGTEVSFAFPLWETLASVAVPLVAIVLGIIFIRRVRFGRTIALIAGPATCILVLGYGGIVVGTAGQERTINSALVQSVRGESQYIAKQMGQTWPGAVSMPPKAQTSE